MRIFEILNQNEVRDIMAALENAPFRPGNEHVTGYAKTVKDNLQADNEDPTMQEITSFIASKIMDNVNVYWLLFPKTMSRPIISRTEDDGRYGIHVDESQMTDYSGLQMRTDISFTLFLSDPDSYEGGELSIHSDVGTADVKLPPGQLVFYKSGLLHEVKPVTSGARIVSIGWIECLIYDETARDALYALREMQEVLGEHVDKGSDVYQNYHAAVNAMRRCLIGRL